jgi:non-specific serine/threonine protein kinase
MSQSLAPVVTPLGAFRLDPSDDDIALERGLAQRLEERFAQGPGHGFVQLGASEAESAVPAALAWCRDFARRFIASVCALGDHARSEDILNLPSPPSHELAAWIDGAPPMRGAEYLRPAILVQIWRAMAEALEDERRESALSLGEFLKAKDSRWRLVGRVHFNLAENRRDPDFPFAFMATYTSGLGANGALRHLPLGQALRDYAGAGAGEKAKLLQLLDPVSKASEAIPWLKAAVDAGEIFHPLRWTAQDALRFLGAVEAMEGAGLVIRMPANWRMNRPALKRRSDRLRRPRSAWTPCWIFRSASASTATS